MRPLRNNIVVERLSNKYGGLIEIPNTDFNLGYVLCKIVAVGKGEYVPQTDKIAPMEVKVGDRTLINQGVLEQLNFKKDGKDVTYYTCPSYECTVILADNEGV